MADDVCPWDVKATGAGGRGPVTAVENSLPGAALPAVALAKIHDVRSDARDLRADRRDLKADVKSGDKAEAKQDLHEIKGDRKDVRHDVHDVKADKRDIRHDRRQIRRDSIK